VKVFEINTFRANASGLPELRIPMDCDASTTSALPIGRRYRQRRRPPPKTTTILKKSIAD
jgi:hypothetical protein